MKLSDSARMRAADSRAIKDMGVESVALMSAASEQVALAALELMRGGRSVYAFCGSGNNGGDGVGAAAYLAERGMNVRVLLVGSRERLTPDTREMERRLSHFGLVIEDLDPSEPGLSDKLRGADVIIDAMFGVGLSRGLSGRALEAVRLINTSGTPVVAADIASGVEADTGRVLGDAVRADITVTFTRAKPGHFVEPGCLCCGELRVCDIGIPEELAAQSEIAVTAVSRGDVSLPARDPLSHKGDFGRLLILGGSTEYTGAPSLCAGAALRSGAGLVSLGVPADVFPIAASKSSEVMTFPLACDGAGRFCEASLPVALSRVVKSDVTALGPGLGRSAELVRFVSCIVESAPCRLVLDADALYALSKNMDILKHAALHPVLTPHEGEFLRMGGALTGDRVDDARRFAEQHRCVLVLKGYRTVCALPDGTVLINTTGNPGMARGGSGDALTGVIAALLCQLPPREAVSAALWLHGRAGDICAEQLGEYGMTVGDLIRVLPAAELEIIRIKPNKNA